MMDLTEVTYNKTNITSGNQEAFALWAPCYDTQPNPLLILEERYLKRLLPKISDRDVLDAGCGSGRWLQYCAGRHPRSLTGVDASEQMLEVADRKGTGAKLVRGTCDQTPFSSKSFDLIILSFVLSYIEDLSHVAEELSRVAKDQCELFLCDMHPETERRLGWKRSFRSNQGEITLKTQRHDLHEIVQIFANAGWTLRAALAPEFDAPEREVFASQGRFDESAGSPAIYILQLHKTPTVPTVEFANPEDAEIDVYLNGGRCALGPDEVQPSSVAIAQGRIASLGTDYRHSYRPLGEAHLRIDLSGYLLLPGLINAHDHLEFSLFPRLASRQYKTATEWAEDIHKRFSETISLHRLVSPRARIWWGGLRNVLCGVTTVCHHNPRLAEFEKDDFPVRIIQHYGWAHSIRFGGDLRAAYAATPEDAPFIIHACEGVGAQSRAELDQLERIGVLDSRTVLVHGLALKNDDAEFLRLRGISLILCPSSNHFLFGDVPSGPLLHGVSDVALGSDSPLTACGDLLDEVRFAATQCSLTPQRLYRMVTDAPAAILRLRNGEGSIKISAAADLVAVRDTGRSPAETLCTLSASDVELVLRDGNIQLASDEMYARLPEAARRGLEPLCVGRAVRWLRAPVKLLLEDAEKVLGKSAVNLGGKRVWLPPHPEQAFFGRSAGQELSEGVRQ